MLTEQQSQNGPGRDEPAEVLFRHKDRLLSYILGPIMATFVFGAWALFSNGAFPWLLSSLSVVLTLAALKAGRTWEVTSVEVRWPKGTAPLEGVSSIRVVTEEATDVCITYRCGLSDVWIQAPYQKRGREEFIRALQAVTGLTVNYSRS